MDRKVECPFCGKEFMLRVYQSPGIVKLRGKCPKCDAEVHMIGTPAQVRAPVKK